MPIIAAGAAVMLAVILFCMLFRGKVFDIVLSFVFGASLCGYLQGTFFNLDLGSLDGTAVIWNRYKTHTAINTLVWFVILMMPFAVYYFRKSLWKGLLRYASVIVTGMQTAALVSLLLTVNHTAPAKQYYLSNEELFTVSQEENVIVFILDYFDNKYLDAILKEDPDFLSPLTGFTHYPDSTSIYPRTHPSLLHLLTGRMYDFGMTPEKNYEESYKNSEYINELISRGYEYDIYGAPNYVSGNLERLEGIASNLKYREKEKSKNNNKIKMLKGMISLSAYRYAPHAFKATFWTYTDEFSKYNSGDDRLIYKINDPVFYITLKRDQLSLKDSKAFKFYHLNGPHRPYRMTEYAQAVNYETSFTAAGKGSLYIVYEYIQQMKELGIYENSTIIITADHGHRYGGNLSTETTPVLFVKPKGESSAPIKVSEAPVSHADYHAYIIKAIGGDYEKFGVPYDMHKEGEDRERIFYCSAVDFERLFKIRGNARNFDNWEEVERIKVYKPFYK